MNSSGLFALRNSSETEASRILGAEGSLEDIGGRPVVVIKSSDGAVSAFCKAGKVYSVRVNAPYDQDVKGVRIGDTQWAVEAVLGLPNRPWPINDGFVRWLYDGNPSVRVDFSTLGLVECIFI
ncbi:hypothetical protein VB151_18045 [Xanthomonas fragariae]|uniref:hypothetical protein n=1 Tax=Xanthomonas fragariae TaxID=48664 RepID=UPI0011AB6AA7|nr:hypothetical protein [Xanthomonas fragariae]MBL9197829.1 hypothetical protein [Xanthomonas fragariae]MBL9219935.1 hypothetical protein [Xanthomonas fragariae]MDM7556281.1 hypothetical protein [Xanthomonas fragariae]MDM7559365.1 hypothetical protein [Xanthomonas fragariae]MDM7573956.1 hypothetical protein [Xanthomonas fragariae]